jgi:hypothetical protein
MNLIWVSSEYCKRISSHMLNYHHIQAHHLLNEKQKENCVSTCQNLCKLPERDPNSFQRQPQLTGYDSNGMTHKPSNNCPSGAAHHIHNKKKKCHTSWFKCEDSMLIVFSGGRGFSHKSRWHWKFNDIIMIQLNHGQFLPSLNNAL